MKQTISPAVLDVLRNAHTTGNVLRITQQLARPLYVETNKILEMLGGKWSRKDKGHTFDGEAAEAVEAAVMTGEVTDYKKLYQFFETPAAIAKQMVTLADIDPTKSVLEPSAGHGAIAAEIANQMPVPELLNLVEIDPDKCAKLRDKFRDSPVHCADFLQFADDHSGHKWSRIIMNPPFRNGQDVRHVRRAFDLLASGGKLVAIMSPSFQFRENGVWQQFRDWLKDQEHTVEELPAGSFSSSGTNVNTVLVTIDKP